MATATLTKIPAKYNDGRYVTPPTPTKYYNIPGGGRGMTEISQSEYERITAEETATRINEEAAIEKQRKENEIYKESMRREQEIQDKYSKDVQQRGLTQQDKINLQKQLRDSLGQLNYDLGLRRVELGLQSNIYGVKTKEEATILRKAYSEGLTTEEIQKLSPALQKQFTYETVTTEVPTTIYNQVYTKKDTSNWFGQIGSVVKKQFMEEVNKKEFESKANIAIPTTAIKMTYNIMKNVPAPQQVVANKITVTQLKKIPGISQLTGIEQAYQKEYPGQPDTLGLGRATYVAKKLEQGFLGKGSLVRTAVEKIPYKTRVAISKTGNEIGSILWKTSPAKPYVEGSILFMQKVPPPQQYVASYLVKNVPTEKLAPFQLIERQYLKEVKAGREPGRTKFITEKLGEGYSQAFTGLAETYFQAKEGKYISPWIKTKYPEYTYKTESKIVGGVGKIIGMSQLYAVPVLGKAMFVAPFAEAAGRRELKTYIKKHPIETIGTLAVFGYPLYKYATKEIKFAEGMWIQPKEKLRVYKQTANILKGEKLIPSVRYEVTQTFEPGLYATVYKPRYAKWLELFNVETSGTIGLKTINVKPTTTISPWFSAKEIEHLSQTYVGNKFLPNLYSVKRIPKTIFVGGKPIIGVSPGKTIIESQQKLALEIETPENRYGFIKSTGKPEKYVIQSKFRELKFYETDVSRIISEKGYISRITPGGKVIPGTRYYEGITTSIKQPMSLVDTYEFQPNEFRVNENIIKSISKNKKVTKVFEWMGEPQTLVPALTPSGEQVLATPKQIEKLITLGKKATFLIPPTPTLNVQSIITETKTASDLFQTTASVLKQIPQYKQVPIVEILPSTKQIPILKESQIPKLGQESGQQQRSEQAIIQKQIPKLIEKQIPKQITKQISRSKINYVPSLTSTIIKPVKELFGGKVQLGKLVRRIKQAYEVQVRRGGKFVSISKKTLPLGKALKLGSEKVTKTLAATFKVVPKGATAESDIFYTPSPLQFRRPKSGEKLTFIELKQLRIKKSSGEIPEILQIRKSTYKARGGKFKW